MSAAGALLPRRVRVIGTGAMASLFAARLALRGRAEVGMAGSWAAALEAVARRGLTLEEGGRSRTVAVAALPLDAPQPPVDLALVLVKGHQTAAVAPLAARHAGADGLLLTLQNGVGHRALLERAAPGRVAAGVATVGARLLAPGRVASTPGALEIGRDARLAAAIEAAAALLADAGFEVALTDDLDAAVWRKLAVNCALNALSALRGVDNGSLLRDAGDRGLLEEAAREVGRVARALGIALGRDPAALAASVAERTAANRSSMLQDLERGAPIELEAINGVVVREARRLGVPTPVNDRLCRELRALSAAGTAP